MLFMLLWIMECGGDMYFLLIMQPLLYGDCMTPAVISASGEEVGKRGAWGGEGVCSGSLFWRP